MQPSSAPGSSCLTAMLVWSPPPVRDTTEFFLDTNLAAFLTKATTWVEGATTTITDLTDHAHYTWYVHTHCQVVDQWQSLSFSTYDECKYRLFVSDCKMSHIHILCITLINSLLFSAAPVGPPLVSVVNTSATSIKIMWTPPSRSREPYSRISTNLPACQLFFVSVYSATTNNDYQYWQGPNYAHPPPIATSIPV